MNPLLCIKNLKVTFSSYRQKSYAVRDISFSLREGEVLGIVGESGCGKSATAKALLQLLPRHVTTLSGEVWYEEKNLLSASEKEMQKVRGKEIGMIFQDPMSALNPTLKIGTQIVEGFLHHNPHTPKAQAREYAIELLNRVGIPNAEKRVDEFPHTLSGGMRQRALIAMALAPQPKILIADEPTTALDVTIQAQILALLKQIQQETKTSIILITHDLSVVAHFCDRVLVMYAGQIVESAPVFTLFKNPKHPYTQSLLKATVRLDRPKSHPLLSIEGQPPCLTSLPPGCAFAPRCHQKHTACEKQQPQLHLLTEEHSCACFLHGGECSK